jgi:hypothetical protein
MSALASLTLDQLSALVTHELARSDYIDLSIAACKIAERYPRPAYRKPLRKLLETATEMDLVKFSRAAANAKAMEVASGTDE